MFAANPTVKPFLVVAILFAVLLGAPAQAEAPRELTWENLVPPAPPLDDPTADLTDDQGIELELIAGIRARRERGMISNVAAETEWAIELQDKLEKQGLDVEALLQRYTAMLDEIEKRNNRLVDGLDGQLVRLPGYVLPLEFNGAAVEEFLLVPYVGACIHVPPPPRNQMVFVRLNQSFALNDLFEPVWITGRLTARAVQKSLQVFDGRIDVDAGYSVDGILVEPYEK